ncbi:tripartite tricarboxylate transporter substrate-binding protein [Cupriavidus pinatubonensis]|uniref:Twin-arginine translocation pathway signal n=1 Tax=Cupriavidus pinatubonensis TaxID=248026 RepID=A0ABN7ZJ14_9BURK|nr:tripartite tricarboxylate transporter substrate-binding protein [Cupriavidus pinatubonensis]CAG9185960.1 hypothetical protein LMG23994_05991 [Cupriavidus pinatubonensis]
MTQRKPSGRIRRLLGLGLFGGLIAGLIAGTAPAVAQVDNWPSRPVRVVVPYTPGGVSDAVTRLVMQKVAERIGQPVVVENRPGANGMIGSDNVAKSAPDGYSLLVVVAAHAINPSLYPKMSYDPIKDLTGVSLIGRIPLLLVSSAQLRPTNVKELVSWGKAHPDKMTFASSGNGSGAHLAGELFAQTTGVKMVHIPYKGISPALQTPPAVLAKISAEMDAVLRQPDVRARLIDYGIDPVGGKADQFQAFIKDESVRWGEVVKKGGVKVE